MGGRAGIISTVAEMRQRCGERAGRPVSGRFADRQHGCDRVDGDRIRVHARGPYARTIRHGRTLLAREQAGAWQYIPAGRARQAS